MAVSIQRFTAAEPNSSLLFHTPGAGISQLPALAARPSPTSQAPTDAPSDADAVHLSLSDQARQLLNQGETVSQIAALLDTNSQTIDSYLDITVPALTAAASSASATETGSPQAVGATVPAATIQSV